MFPLKKLIIVLIIISAYSFHLSASEFNEKKYKELKCNFVTDEEKKEADKLNREGERLYHEKIFTSALSKFRNSLNLYPCYSQALSNLGLVLNRLGKKEEAIEANQKAIDFASGKRSNIIKSGSYYNIGKIYESLGRWMKSKENYNEALKYRNHKAYINGIARVNRKIKESEKELLTEEKKHFHKDFIVVNSLTRENEINWTKDEFWKRAEIIRAKNENERLFQIRFYNDGDTPGFVFMRSYKKGDDYFAQIVEFNNGFHIIDDFRDTLRGGETLGRKNYDNLYIKDGILYYYKKMAFYDDNKKTRSYVLGSGKPPEKISVEFWKKNNIRFTHDTVILANQSPDKKITAYVSVFSLSLFFGDVYKQLTDVTFPIEKLKYSKKILLSDISNIKESCDLIVGSVSWSSDSRYLFFDNSGICAACIYQIDIKNSQVTKIVPEHEAIQPYFFEWRGKEYVAYVEKNMIKIAKR